MKLNSLVSKTLPSLLLLCSSATFAFDSVEKFKVAVVKDTTGADKIIAGEYTDGMKAIEMHKKIDYNHAMNLCAAQIKTFKFEKAEESCTKAIDSMSANATRGRHGKLLKALAYSNRSIAKHLNNESYSAYEDLLTAKSLSENAIILDNIAYFKSSTSMASSVDLDTVAAD
ncbi:hypothetical protein Q4493_12545 [Colwellia sp. 1_MG-2023]|uniref:hypothetical protein n=1 Tax=Colwellia sp. 1_MG-2023 TaxID=3062649 RepID=UPI0026E11E62|nr:hypothetical protein [Colwellia sp. 1_MG-2023]MDO6446605.1 hypothetical protein [Colwellia sp. 1_MG-2023]